MFPARNLGNVTQSSKHGEASMNATLASKPAAWMRWLSRPYLAIALLGACIALVGFWPKYFSKMAAFAPDSPWYIHVHAAVFSGWLALLGLQAWLAANRHLRVHRKVGRILIPYAILIVFVGWMVAILSFRDRIPAEGFAAASNRLYVPFTDVIFFAPVAVGAWWFRHRPEVHKRLIVVATTVLLIAAAHRAIGNNFGRPPALTLVLPLWLSPILLGMSVDWVRARRVHLAYLIGIAIVVLMKFRPQLQHTEAWTSFATWLARW
jgi:hypothetical protein